MGGTAKRNLKVFREICGDKNLGHVRIVTTNWNLVDEKQGNSRQVALAEGAFKPLIDAQAELCRHDKGLESALLIMSQLIHQEPVTMKIQEELNAGRNMGDTSAGAVIIEEMEEVKKKHNRELEVLKKELEDASKANDEELRTELAEERRKLEEMIARAEEDQKTLKKRRTLQWTQPTFAAHEQWGRRSNSTGEEPWRQEERTLPSRNSDFLATGAAAMTGLVCVAVGAAAPVAVVAAVGVGMAISIANH